MRDLFIHSKITKWALSLAVLVGAAILLAMLFAGFFPGLTPWWLMYPMDVLRVEYAYKHVEHGIRPYVSIAARGPSAIPALRRFAFKGARDAAREGMKLGDLQCCQIWVTLLSDSRRERVNVARELLQAGFYSEGIRVMTDLDLTTGLPGSGLVNDMIWDLMFYIQVHANLVDDESYYDRMLEHLRPALKKKAPDGRGWTRDEWKAVWVGWFSEYQDMIEKAERACLSERRGDSDAIFECVRSAFPPMTHTSEAELSD